MAASANNNPSTFIGSVKLLNTEDKKVQLFNYVTKSCEEFGNAENLNGLNKILNELNPSQYPVATFCAITTKFHIHGKYNIEELKATITKFKTMALSLPAEARGSKFPSIFFAAVKALADACLNKKVPLLGIKPVIELLQWYTDGQPELLTPGHASLLCLCLKARHFYLCDPFINIDAELLLQLGIDCRKNSNSPLNACGSEPILLFFYYAALIRVAQCRYEEGLLLLEQLICMKGMCNSSIAIEGFKIAVIVSLILEKDHIFLPGCRNVKFLQSSTRAYMVLAYIADSASLTDDIPSLIKEFVEKNRKIFQMDGTIGLIDVLVRKVKERKIKAMPKTFINVDRKRAMTRTFFNDNEIFDSIVRKLINSGELQCSIDGGSDLYRFHKLLNGAPVEEEGDAIDLTAQLQDLAALTTSIRSVHDRLKVVPPTAQSGKSKKRFMT